MEKLRVRRYNFAHDGILNRQNILKAPRLDAQEHPKMGVCTESGLRIPVTDEQFFFFPRKGLSGKVNMSMLKIGHHGPFSNIRRLSNTSHPEKNPHFPTEWTVYWEDGSIWKKYEEVKKKGLRSPLLGVFVGVGLQNIDPF